MSFKSLSKYDYKNEPKYVHLADNIINKTANELKNEKRLHLIGHGGSLMYDVKKLGISFVSIDEITIEEGRKLIQYCAQKFLSNINSNEQIRPYLNTVPFEAKDIDVAISFKERDMGKNHSIDFISMHYGKIVYDISDKEETLKTVHEETYDEALKIVESEKFNKEIKSTSE
ncbi:MAG TPA: hypothetical protein ENH96_03045 [Chlamydiae bacterium]|nr:hypothetical protein [Chlamydiota bacterium]